MDIYEHANSAMKSGHSSQQIHEMLENLVIQAKQEGVKQRDVYDALSRVAEEHGCNDDRYDDQSELCDTIGSIMDRVWGWCSKGKEFWDTTLSDNTGKP